MIAARMTAIIPDGFRVEAADGMLWYSAEDGRFPGQSGDYHLGRSGTDLRANLEGRRADEEPVGQCQAETEVAQLPAGCGAV
jgi:hypothetical protein